MKQSNNVKVIIGCLGIFCVLYGPSNNQPQSKKQVSGRVGGGAQRVIEAELSDEEIRNKAEQLFNKDLNKKEKEESVTNLVDRAIVYLEKHSLPEACVAFTHEKSFIEGEIYPFVLDIHGHFLAHGEQKNLLWKNMYNEKDDFGSYFVQEMIAKAKNGGGWVFYSWRNAIKNSYVKMVQKNDELYVIGAGYYPHTKADLVVGLVQGAVAIFHDIMAEKKAVEEVFSDFSYPLHNRFVIGDLYLYALDFKGNIVAQGDRPGLIGTNSWDYKDSEGKLVNQEIVKKLQESEGGVWVEYISKKAKKRAYAQKVIDNQGNSYFIACGYYPEVDRKSAEDLVGKAAQYMEAQGKGEAVRQFTNKRDDSFRNGDLYIVVYDMNGIAIAHGGNDELVGKNMYDEKDDDGRYYVRECIQKAKDGGGWIDYKSKNSFQSVYVEEVDLGVDRFVITCGMYPVSKSETMMLLLKSGASLLKTGNTKEVLRSFVDNNSKYIRGDLNLFVLDSTGICYAWGDKYTYIWQNLMNVKDENNQFYIKSFIDSVKFGSAKVAFKLNNRQAIAALEKVEKDGKAFIVGSSYYF